MISWWNIVGLLLFLSGILSCIGAYRWLCIAHKELSDAGELLQRARKMTEDLSAKYDSPWCFACEQGLCLACTGMKRGGGLCLHRCVLEATCKN